MRLNADVRTRTLARRARHALAEESPTLFGESRPDLLPAQRLRCSSLSDLCALVSRSEVRSMSSDYDSDSCVRARLLDFLGGTCLEEVTAHFISVKSGGAYGWFNPLVPSALSRFPPAFIEISRSLWDRESLIVDLDMEYVNFDYAAEPYRSAERAFAIQQPVVDAIEELLTNYGIAPLHLLSGRGHHFIWRADKSSHTMGALAQLGRLPTTVEGKYGEPQAPRGERVPKDMAAAFAGLGMVMEFLTHRVLEVACAQCEIPIQLTAVDVGPIRRGREIVSLDVSQYGDPLYTRTTRLPFSAYLKPQLYCARPSGPRLPKLFAIPLFEMDVPQGLAVMRDPNMVRVLARRATTQIPEQSRGTEALVAAYGSSSLSHFHDYFYSAEHDPPHRWPTGYDQLPLNALPRCAAHILCNPNDLLLKPAGIQHIARTLTAVGWHPRHIAGLIRSKYERNFGWTPGWYVYDAALRADFYVRLFTGLIADGLDPLIDYNCKSMQEKRFCWSSGCGKVLEEHRELLAKDATATGRRMTQELAVASANKREDLS
jgi:hypothetical protein